MRTTLSGGRVLTGGALQDGLSVTFEDGRIVRVGAGAPPNPGRTEDLQGALLLPGFIDTQVNGGGGVLFNDAPTAETIRTIGEAHRAYGATGFLPTLISDDLAVVAQALDAAADAIAQGVPGVLGVHIEGPFLNVERKGIHDASKFRRLDEQAFELLTRFKAGVLLLTLAPETTTPDMIRRLAEAGVRVSAGHTNADYECVRTALDAGLSGFTHLFNAMSPMTSRAPGVVGAALSDDRSWCGLIIDGVHVHPASARAAMRAKGPDKIMLVSDAMPSVGAARKDFVLQGRAITVKDGVCRDADGVLAGSDLDMAGAVRNAMRMMGAGLNEACIMASAAPAAFLGLEGELGEITEGRRADLVVADDDLNIIRTFIGGAPSA
jgi:N-acetylglucosamine-6-phosphate deacetylase